MSDFPYSAESERLMIKLFNNLSEKDKRHYAAVEAVKLGHGGIKYISELFAIGKKTVRNGVAELKKTTTGLLDESVEREADVSQKSKRITR